MVILTHILQIASILCMQRMLEILETGQSDTNNNNNTTIDHTSLLIFSLGVLLSALLNVCCVYTHYFCFMFCFFGCVCDATHII